MKAHVAQWKKEEVKEVTKLIKDYNVTGIADITGLPSAQLQKIKSKLKQDGIFIRIVKKRLVNLALKDAEKVKKNILNMTEELKGIPALIFTNNNAFKLSKIIDKNKSEAFAKPGQIAPHDIIISEGPTPFPAGPMIGELGQIGLKVMVDKGKITVREAKTVAKAGEAIKPKVAEIMTKLNIKPMEVGLRLIAAYESGTIFKEDILKVDEKAFINKLKTAYTESFNLALNIYYTTKETIQILLRKAHLDSYSLAISQEIITDMTLNQILKKAENQMLNLKNKINN